MSELLLNYIIPNLRSETMNRTTRSSYEGFRRKNSLNTLDQSTNSNPSEITYMRSKHKEDLKLVENMSMELQKLSKRSDRSRSYCEQNLCQPPFPQETSSQVRFFNKTKHTTSLQNIDVEVQESEGQKREKVTSLAFFNKFDTIEQSHSLCEQQIIDDKPATARNPTTKNMSKPSQNKQTLKSSVPNPGRKATGPSRTQTVANNKKDRLHPDMKNQITELDKMKKELEAKRFAKEPARGIKPTPNVLNRRTKESNILNPKEPKESQPNKNLPYQGTQKVEVVKSARNAPRAIPVPLFSKNFNDKLLNSEREASQFEELEKTEEEPMAATRMLSEKQKKGLVERLMGMREVIQKNEVCSDSLQEINFHMAAIEKLLTR